MPDSALSAASLPTVRIGLPVWQDPYWQSTWLARQPAAQLPAYGRRLNSIEGNTTFYSLPDPQTVTRWASAVPEHFRFTFKFNQVISHEAGLRDCEALVDQQLHCLAGLGDKLGLMLLQLPAQFGPDRLPLLAAFLKRLPDSLNVAVEVRHCAFFAKSDDERYFNRLLQDHGANRMIMDTRALFTGPSDCALVSEVRTKKPRVPVNVVATGQQPVVRFVGNNVSEDNARCLVPWINKCHQWRTEGRTPYFFFHRPDNKDAPWLAQQFIDAYNRQYPDMALPSLELAAVPAQSALF
ncbi:DUF72 domain-containing protein [Alteromonas halophila]|nr:DUF72 domain-containing protein [Alteromonas halophila]